MSAVYPWRRIRDGARFGILQYLLDEHVEVLGDFRGEACGAESLCQSETKAEA